MRKWLLNLHLYGGLLCAPYLVIFGFSSLQFNHHFRFVEPRPNSTTWEAPLNVSLASNNEAQATAVRDSLGLMGWTIPWNMKRDGAGDLQFNLERPGKSYTIQTVAAEHKVRVQERHKGFWQVLDSLHALGKVPNSRFVAFWGWYTELCTWFVVFASVSGLYLWIESRRERRIGLITLAVAMTCAAGLICFIVLHG